MIKFAEKNQKQEIINIWKTSFPDDTPEFVEMYFAQKYKEENTLIYMVENKVVSCLQMLPYEITFYNHICKMSYICGAATLPDYQNKGIMGKLLSKSFLEMKNRGDIFTVLIPQELWLIEYYQKYGYALCSKNCLNDVLDDISFYADTLDNIMARILDVQNAEVNINLLTQVLFNLKF